MITKIESICQKMESDQTAIILKDDETSELHFFLTPKKFTNPLRKLNNYPIYIGYYEYRLLCQEYFGFGLGDKFIAHNAKDCYPHWPKMMRDLRKQVPLFEKYKVKTITITKNMDLINITLSNLTQ